MLRTAFVVAFLSVILPTIAPAEDLLPNTIDCAAFTKRADGTWYVPSRTTFDAGETKAMTIDHSNVAPGAVTVGSRNGKSADLYALIEAKCGKK
jgi:hypothetical protein